MPAETRSTMPDPGSTLPATVGTPIRFVTEDGSTVTIIVDPVQSGANPTEALAKAKDAVRCLADAFARAEHRVATRPDEAGAVFRSWAYRQ